MAILSIAGLYGASGGFTTAFGWGIASLISGGLSNKDTSYGKLKNLDTQTSQPDQPIPWIFGRQRVAGNIIWSSRLREHKTTHKSGKKGGLFKSAKSTEYWYSEAALVVFCRGPITRFDAIQMDSDAKLFWNYNNGSQKPFSFTADSGTGTWTKDNGGGIVLLNGTETQLPLGGMESVEGVGLVPAYRGRACIYFNDLDLRNFGGRFPVVTAWPISPITSVADILRLMIAECGKRARFPIDTSSDVTDDIDVSAVRAYNVTSFMIESLDTAEKRVEELGMLFGFDWVKQGRKLVCIRRGGNVIRSIPEGELRWARPNSASPVRGESVVNKQDLPMAVEISYINPAKKFRSDVSRSPIMPEAVSRKVERITTTASLSAPQARQIAKRVCYEIWNRARQRTEYLDWKHLDLMASDAITIPTPLGSSDWLIESAIGELMGPLEVKLNPHDQYIYGHLAELNPPVDPDEEMVSTQWDAALVFASDAPGLSNGNGGDDPDTLSVPGVWCAASQYADNEWSGATVLMQAASGSDWKQVEDSFRIDDKATMGELSSVYTPLPPEAGYVPSQSIDVEMYSGSLHSVPIEDVRGGANTILFENGLFICFKDATPTGTSLNGGGLYTLSTIKAGLAGSDDYIPLIDSGLLSPGLRFILVRTEDNAPGPGIIYRTLPRSIIARTLRIEASVNPNYDDGEDSYVSVRDMGAISGDNRFSAQNMQPYAPTVETAHRDGSGNLILSGRARSRYVENQSIADTNLWRMSEPQFSGQYKYEVSITSGATTKIVAPQYTMDDLGTYSWTISASSISSALGFTPGAGTLSGTVALYGTLGPGRKRQWAED